jgi:Zn-finger domain-containing protein
MKITVWSMIEKGVIRHNHIENGWVDNDYPKPLKGEYVNQKAWKNMKWIRKYAHLVNGVVCSE